TMRRLAAFALLVGVFVVPGQADAASADELFRHFNLFGTWATDCKNPPTPSNPFVSITTPSAGLILEDHNLGPDYAVNRYSVLSARVGAGGGGGINRLLPPGRGGGRTKKAVLRGRQKAPPHHVQSNRRWARAGQRWNCGCPGEQDPAAKKVRRRQRQPLIFFVPAYCQPGTLRISGR